MLPSPEPKAEDLPAFLHPLVNVNGQPFPEEVLVMPRDLKNQRTESQVFCRENRGLLAELEM